ncbi:MAG: hypothetical protein OQK69_10110 [Gammaproteobacteria bacterium]|nr:hypothetical protein [Gammaproteobacteria bacterium]
MKKTILIISAIVVGLYILADWATMDPEVVEQYKQIAAEAQKQENLRMINMTRKMHPIQVMGMVQDRKMMMSQMIQAEPDHSEIKKILKHKLKALNNVKTKDDYINYLHNDSIIFGTD